MQQDKALELLVQAVLLAQKRGAFELGEAKILADAVEAFTKKTTQPANEVKTTTQTDGSVESPKEYLPETKDNGTEPTQNV